MLMVLYNRSSKLCCQSMSTQTVVIYSRTGKHCRQKCNKYTFSSNFNYQQKYDIVLWSAFCLHLVNGVDHYLPLQWNFFFHFGGMYHLQCRIAVCSSTSKKTFLPLVGQYFYGEKQPVNYFFKRFSSS